MFKRTFDALGINFLGAITSKSYDVVDVYNDTDAIKDAEFLVQKLS